MGAAKQIAAPALRPNQRRPGFTKRKAPVRWRIVAYTRSHALRGNALSRSERRHSRQSTFAEPQGVSSFAPRKNALSRSERRHSRQSTLSSFAEPRGVSSFAPRKNALSRSERRHSRQSTLSSFAEPQGVSSFALRGNARLDALRPGCGVICCQGPGCAWTGRRASRRAFPRRAWERVPPSPPAFFSSLYKGRGEKFEVRP